MSYIGKKNGNPNTDFLEAGGELENHDLVTVDSSGRIITPTVNRTFTDGTVITIAKDGTTVGSIGTNGSRTYIGSGSGQSGLKFNLNGIVAVNGADGSIADASYSLGVSSVRFTDAYLSGGVYVGGTGSANYLDDFEEGTFTPTYRGYSTTPTVTYDSGHEGYYVKVGKMVYCMIHMRTDAISGITTDTLYIGGLPFTVATGSNSNTWTSGGNVWADGFLGEEPEILMARWNTNMCMLGYRTAFGTNPTANSTDDLDTGVNKNNLYATITYLTDS